MGSPPVRLPTTTRTPQLLVLLVVMVVGVRLPGGEGTMAQMQTTQQWCIARSAAVDEELQAALDYACGAGMADCQPIQPSGLCYLPNTMQAHASYAFNGFFQRSRAAPGACDFAGTATVTITDPSYGSCTFPSSSSTAEGSTSANTPTTSPGTTILSPPGIGSTTGGGGAGGGLTPIGGLTPATTGFNPGFGPTLPNTDISAACVILLPVLLFTSCYIVPLLL